MREFRPSLLKKIVVVTTVFVVVVFLESDGEYFGGEDVHAVGKKKSSDQ